MGSGVVHATDQRDVSVCSDLEDFTADAFARDLSDLCYTASSLTHAAREFVYAASDSEVYLLSCD